jgi:hypothetical protein
MCEWVGRSGWIDNNFFVKLASDAGMQFFKKIPLCWSFCIEFCAWRPPDCKCVQHC